MSKPFGLSLSKGCLVFIRRRKKQGFDKLSPNGDGIILCGTPGLCAKPILSNHLKKSLPVNIATRQRY
jgi:hypothetical protein